MSVINVASGHVLEYQGPLPNFLMRIFVKKTFVDSDGKTHLSFEENPDEIFAEVPCTVVNNVIVHDGFDIVSTTDALADPKLTSYFFSLYTTDGEVYQEIVHKNIVVPHYVNPTTLGDLVAFSAALEETTETTFTRSQILAMFANLINMGVKATELQYGAVRLNIPADDPADPVVVGDNDPRLSASGADTRLYRSNYPDFDTAATAAIGKELAFSSLDVIASTKTLSNFIKTSVSGDGKWDVEAGHGLTVKNLLDPGDRKLNIGEGELFVHNLPYIRQAWYTGPFGQTTQLDGSIDDSVDTFDLLDASVRGPAPFVICIEKEFILVNTVDGNTCSDVVRGYDGTDAAVHGDLTAVYAAITDTMWSGMIGSIEDMGGGVILGAPGKWKSKRQNATSAMILRGANSTPDGVSGTVYLPIEDSAYLFHIGHLTEHVGFEYLSIDLSDTTGSVGVDISGVAGQFMLNCWFKHVKFYRGEYGWRAFDSGGNATFMALNIYNESCEFNYQTVGNYGLGTVNGSILFNQCNFTPAATARQPGTAVCGDHNYAGPPTFINCTFNGQTPVSPQTYHTPVTAIDYTENLISTGADHKLDVGATKLFKTYLAELEMCSKTVVAPAGATSGTNLKSVITSRGLTGGVQTVDLIDVSGTTTAAEVAEEIRLAVNAAASVNGAVTMYRDGDKLYLRKKYHGDRQAAFSFTIEAGTSDPAVGVTFDTATADREFGYGLPSTSITPDRTDAIDAINLDRQHIWLQPNSATSGHAYMKSDWSQLGPEENYRLNFIQEADELDGGIDDAVTTITVLSAAGLGDVLGSNILIESEEMTVEAIDGNDLIVIRGANGTTPATHTNGQDVFWVAPTVHEYDVTDLAENINDSVDEFEVTSIEQIAVRSNIRIDNEEMTVLERNTTENTIYVARGANGSTPASHTSGANIYHISPTIQLRTNQPVREGKPYAVFRIRNTMTPVTVIGGSQDEAIPYFAVIESTFEKQKALIIEGMFVQSQLLCKSKAIIQTKNCLLPADWAMDEWGVEAEYISENDQIYRDEVIGGYKDLGNTLHHEDRMTVSSFAGYSKLHKENIPDQHIVKSYMSQMFTLDKGVNNIARPLVEYCRPRGISEHVWTRYGSREDHQKDSTQMPNYHDTIVLDPDTFTSIPFPWQEWWLMHISKASAVGTKYDGEFFNKDLAHRGRLINVHSHLLEPDTGVVTLYGNDGPIYYLDELTSNIVVNVENTDEDRKFRPVEIIRINIPIGATSYQVQWGNGIYAPGNRAWNTGTVGTHWVCYFDVWGGNQLTYLFRTRVGADGPTTPDDRYAYRFPSANPETSVIDTPYLSNNGSLQEFALPLKSNVGNWLEYAETQGGGIEITQAAGQYVIWNGGGVAGIDRTTTGETGKLESDVGEHDSIKLVCIEANLGWQVVWAKGNWTLT